MGGGGGGRKSDFGAVDKCSKVVCEVSRWHKKIAIGGLSAASAQTANKIRLNFHDHTFSIKPKHIIFKILISRKG